MEKRVAITLWRLGTNQEYRSVAHLFGVGTSSVCNIVHEVTLLRIACWTNTLYFPEVHELWK